MAPSCWGSCGVIENLQTVMMRLAERRHATLLSLAVFVRDLGDQEP
jgi:hypothetical protein